MTEPYQLQTATVLAADLKEDLATVTVQLSREDYLRYPIAPASLWQKDASSEEAFAFHRLVCRQGPRLVFEASKPEFPLPSVHSTYTFCSRWSLYQLELAQDDIRQWHRMILASGKMIMFRGPNGTSLGRRCSPPDNDAQGTVVEGGWDHEHCALCWVKISAAESDAHEAYSDGIEWLCDRCYKRFILSGFGKTLGDRLTSASNGDGPSGHPADV